MKKYKVSSYHSTPKIEEVEALRETKDCVYVPRFGGGERRTFKQGAYESYFDTWELAHSHILERAQGEVDGIRANLERANGKLGNIKGMKKP